MEGIQPRVAQRWRMPSGAGGRAKNILDIGKKVDADRHAELPTSDHIKWQSDHPGGAKNDDDLSQARI